MARGMVLSGLKKPGKGSEALGRRRTMELSPDPGKGRWSSLLGAEMTKLFRFLEEQHQKEEQDRGN